MVFMLLILGFLSPVAPAAPSDRHWLEAEQGLKKIHEITTEDRGSLGNLVSKFEKKCGTSPSPACRLSECDAFPGPSCRKGRVLLFRGEDRMFELASTSALYRSRLKGSRFTGDLGGEALLKEFSSALGVLRLFLYGPQAEPVLLKSTPGGGAAWVWKQGEEPVKPYDGITAPLPSALTAYLFHVEASYLFYREPDGRDSGIDPLISYTSDPKVARAFATPDEAARTGPGRVIVLSVPASDLTPLCGKGTGLVPGAVLDPRSCREIGNEHSEELELDVVLYTKSDWIFRAYLW
jgi:hypothetical protein